MKKLALASLSIIPLGLLLCGCDAYSANKYIKDISISEADGKTTLTITYMDGETKDLDIAQKSVTDVAFEYVNHKIVCHTTYSDGTSKDSEVNDSIVSVSKSELNADTDNVTITLGDGTTYTYSLPKKAVTSIAYVQTTEEGKQYQVSYSNGTTSSIIVKDGDAGKDATISEIFATCVEKGLYSNGQFEQFLTDYLTITASDVKAATNKAIQSCVTVYSEHRWDKTYAATLQTIHKSSVSCGAGVLYKIEDDPNGYSYVITNYHVVYDATAGIAKKLHLFQYGTSEYVQKTTEKDADDYYIYEYGDGAVEAEYIGGSLNQDIAILKVKTSLLKEHNPDLRAVDIASEYHLADTAIAIGNPEGDGFSATIGHVSKESENLDMTAADESTEVRFRVLRIDTAVNGGNSGGGLFNDKAELIGIVNAKALRSSAGNVLDDMSYALPVDNVTKVADNILYYYNQNLMDTTLEDKTASLKKLVLGVTYQPVEGYAEYDSVNNKITLHDTLKIVEVDDEINTETNTYKIGHRLELEKDDIITSITINGDIHTLTHAYELSDWLLTIRVGDVVTFAVTKSDLTVANPTITVTANDLTIIK